MIVFVGVILAAVLFQLVIGFVVLVFTTVLGIFLLCIVVLAVIIGVAEALIPEREEDEEDD